MLQQKMIQHKMIQKRQKKMLQDMSRSDMNRETKERIDQSHQESKMNSRDRIGHKKTKLRVCIMISFSTARNYIMCAYSVHV